MMKKLAVGLLTALLLVAALLPAGAEMNKYSTLYWDTFDTVIQLIGYAESEDEFSKQAEQMHQMYLYMHKLFDTYNSYESEGIVSIYTLNERAAKEPVAVDPILFSLLTYCKSNYELCQEQVNIAMGSVLSLWHTYRDAGLENPDKAALPPMEQLVAAKAHTNMDDLVLDSEKMTVYFADPDLKLDVGAVAKGYATEIVAKVMEGGEMPSFLISAGGNVRAGIAPQDGRKAWGIGIQDPDSAAGYVEVLYIADKSVVTSGDYQRFYTVDGVNYHHLIDPDTLMPSTDFRSVSIITDDSGYADMLSTTAFLMPYEQSRAFIESLDGVEAIWVFPDQSIQMTEGAMDIAQSCGATNK